MAALITVVMPAHNAAATLAQTLASLAQQTQRDFELLLVDDASNDGTAGIAEQFAGSVPLKLLRNETKAGVARSLNRGIAESDSEFIARLDADDLAQPVRLVRQLEFLRAQPRVDLVGSQMAMFRSLEEGPLGLLTQPTEDRAIRTALLQRNVIAHPSLLARRSFFVDVGAYNPALDYAEDYDLWCRGALLGKRFANIAEPLTWYRVHAASVSQSKAQTQYERDVEARRRYMTALLGDVPAGWLPQLFAGGTRFASREAAAMAFAQSAAALLGLGRRVPDAEAYADLVKACLERHLLEGQTR
jgi:glycosyltransferase involved in cell wall biosynthesis